MFEKVCTLLDAVEAFSGEGYKLYNVDVMEKSIFVLPLEYNYNETLEDRVRSFEKLARTIRHCATVKMTAQSYEQYYHYETELFDGWVMKTCFV